MESNPYEAPKAPIGPPGRGEIRVAPTLYAFGGLFLAAGLVASSLIAAEGIGLVLAGFAFLVIGWAVQGHDPGPPG